MDKNDNQTEQKRIMTEKIKRYYNQVKYGCNRDLCYNKFCFKSKGKIKKFVYRAKL